MDSKVARLGLVLLAAIAVAAAVAPAAGASEFMTEGGKYPAAISSFQVGEHVFTVKVEKEKSNEIKCKSVSFSGELAKSSSELTLHPEYSGCTAFGLAATVTTAGCDYLLSGGKEFASMAFAGAMEIVCGASSSIRVKTATCELKIGAQKPSGETLNTMTTIKQGEQEWRELDHDWKASALSYVNLSDGVGCPLPDTSGHSDGTYSGYSESEATFEGKFVGFTVGP